MIYSFEVENTGENFVIDTETMKWGIASSILSAPSIVAAENNMAKYEFRVEGLLIPQGAGSYSFDGRTPKDGLSVVGILSILFKDKNVLVLQPNSPVKEGSFKCNMPAVYQPCIVYEIRNPQKNEKAGEVTE